jgi:hypothetical protein
MNGKQVDFTKITYKQFVKIAETAAPDQWKPELNRFVGPDSTFWNQKYQKVVEAEKKRFKERSPEEKRRDFVKERKEYLEAIAGINKNRTFFGVVLRSLDQYSVPTEEKEANDRFNWYCYLIERTKKPNKALKCTHTDMGIKVKCDCRPGNKDPNQLVISDEILESELRMCLSVIVDGVRINIKDEDTSQNIREKVRTKIPMIEPVKPKDELDSLMDFGRQCIRNQGRNPELNEQLCNSFLPLNIAMSVRLGNTKALDKNLKRLEEYTQRFEEYTQLYEGR